MNLFEQDLNTLEERLCKHVNTEVCGQLNILKEKLFRLREKNVVKIAHSVMELVCAKHLLLKGYEVDIEHPLDGGLTCDLYGVKGFGSLIIEIETGYIPPKYALDPMTYTKMRIVSKIARYGSHATKFVLGTPPHYILQVLPILIDPPRFRDMGALKKIKALCDLYYQKPPVSLDELQYTRLHAIYIINVDDLTVSETELESYAHQYFNRKNE